MTTLTNQITIAAPRRAVWDVLTSLDCSTSTTPASAPPRWWAT